MRALAEARGSSQRAASGAGRGYPEMKEGDANEGGPGGGQEVGLSDPPLALLPAALHPAWLDPRKRPL